MKIPKPSSKQLFKDGVFFCYQIHKMLLEVREGSAQLRSILRRTVEIQEDSDHSLWLAIGSKPSQPPLCLWFKLKPDYSLLVEGGWVKVPAKRKDSLNNLDKDMTFWHWDEKWRDGFGITGKLTPKLEGNADLIKDWYERAARLAIQHGKVK